MNNITKQPSLINNNSNTKIISDDGADDEEEENSAIAKQEQSPDLLQNSMSKPKKMNIKVVDEKVEKTKTQSQVRKETTGETEKSHVTHESEDLEEKEQEEKFYDINFTNDKIASIKPTNALVTNKDIPKDVAIAIQALGELKKSKRSQLLNHIKSNAVTFYENSKMHYQKVEAELKQHKNSVVKKLEETGNNILKRRREEEEEEEGKKVEKKERNNDNNVTCVDATGIPINQPKKKSKCTTTKTYNSITMDTNTNIVSKAVPTTKNGKKKRGKISQALQRKKLKMSIESKKKLFTCLHLLKLANKNLSNKVNFLQDLVQKEQCRKKENNSMAIETKGNSEVFVDASDQILKMEVIGTVKKVYTLISKYTGNSLPEPARSKVRETLLKLPAKWSMSIYEPSNNNNNNSNSNSNNSNDNNNNSNSTNNNNNKGNVLNKISGNKKILVLAKESLDMVSNVIDVVDETLGKAEEWVKHKQLLKEMLREKLEKRIHDSTSTPNVSKITNDNNNILSLETSNSNNNNDTKDTRDKITLISANNNGDIQKENQRDKQQDKIIITNNINGDIQKENQQDTTKKE
ncbi:uncharacterized protein SCODWIG_01863 [Saccharomycodes ludwigii]|uniref:Transcriptional repressor OPI1 n=1 Tax=Saccharomycodes ludwigii TaxID=36035 RepID=A0A376B638_9ASCO|nr:uncharacterized protein SCODWIG_01863 [Saccharomycodes ludwigii]